ncbi:MAG: type III-B CRISPR module-associated protein Cmr3 [Hydrogenothermaceae bacterium]|nr:type III-B CRISPR module-associated protein Cmr3 [Hydrogenothermaceae bacterium]
MNSPIMFGESEDEVNIRDIVGRLKVARSLQGKVMLKVSPFDVFLFGDGKEFNRGSTNVPAEQVFLNPVPILGTLNRKEGKTEHTVYSSSKRK